MAVSSVPSPQEHTSYPHLTLQTKFVKVDPLGGFGQGSVPRDFCTRPPRPAPRSTTVVLIQWPGLCKPGPLQNSLCWCASKCLLQFRLTSCAFSATILRAVGIIFRFWNLPSFLLFGEPCTCFTPIKNVLFCLFISLFHNHFLHLCLPVTFLWKPYLSHVCSTRSLCNSLS